MYGEKKKRDAFWQAVRGACILAVVMIHCPDASVYAYGSIEFNTWILLRQLIDFPVAVFFFMSGYFVNIDKCEENQSKWYLTRGGGILVPYLIWSLFYSAISLLRSVLISEPIRFSSYLFKLLTGGAATPFYFIVCLLQLTVLTPWLIQAIKRNGKLSRFLWVVTPLYMVLIYIGYVIAPEIMESTVKGVVFPAWLLFYYLGLNIKIKGDEISQALKGISQFKMIVFAFILECVEAGIILKLGYGSGFATSQMKVSSFLYSAAICLWLYKISGNKQKVETKSREILAYVGDCSYEIFYIHCFILMILTRVYNYAGISDIWILKFTICFILTAILSVLVVDVVNILARALKIDRSLKWIGF